LYRFSEGKNRSFVICREKIWPSLDDRSNSSGFPGMVLIGKFFFGFYRSSACNASESRNPTRVNLPEFGSQVGSPAKLTAQPTISVTSRDTVNSAKALVERRLGRL